MIYWTNQGISDFVNGLTASTIAARDYKFVKDIIQMKWYCCGNGQSVTIGLFPIANTLDCMHDQKFIVGGGTEVSDNSKRKYVLRRLTPTECARLQGFPDWWCDGADGSDSAQYKLWGNGIALPCAYDVLGRIARAYEAERTTMT